VIPKNATKTDWEVELAIVIGKKMLLLNRMQQLNMLQDFICKMITAKGLFN